LSQRLPNLIMQIEWLTVWYPWKELVTLPNKIEITKEMHIWIIWKNWIWKTTLIKTILWELQPLHWSVKVHPELRVGSYSQVFEDLHPMDTVIEAIMWTWISYQDARAFLWALQIDVEKMDHKVSSLSWWEMAKVALTKMLLQRPHVIIMDEPTNHLDLWSKETIKMMLQWFNGVTLIVSHDRDFLEWTSNMLWWIWDNHLTVFHDLQRGFQELESSCWKW
jgi:ATPase subunit of ABC transporter with duplicated ATPase domains